MSAKRIAVVEDDAFIRADLTEILEMEGYEVHAFANGREALDGLSGDAASPRLIVLDLMMPVMTGYEFLERVTDAPRLAAIPIVVVSADGQAEARLPRERVRLFMKKPIDLDAFLNAVAALSSS